MLTYKEAEKKIAEAFPIWDIYSSVDLDEEYVFVLSQKKSKRPNTPETRISVDKHTGEINDFFPRDISKYNRMCQTRTIKKPAMARR